MRKAIIFALFFILALSATVSAQSKEDYKIEYDKARFLYATANACLAAYDDRIGNIFYTFMQYDGWEAEHIRREGSLADANVFVAKKQNLETGKTTYIVSFRGTASSKDIRLDKRTGRVLFAGSSLEEIKRNATKEDVPETQPKVHRGFLQYTLEVFTVDLEHSSIVTGSNHLYDVIREDPDSELIVTGHSLGGAGAVLYAASIINMGVPTQQVKVVTFGAPAIGNKAFAEEYEKKIDLTRVYSPLDPVPGALQSFHSYTQFGDTLLVKSNPQIKAVQHDMENYADLMGKHYYDAKEEAIQQGAIPADALSHDEGTGPIVAVAVIRSPDSDYAVPDFKYARENLLDIYRWSFLRYRILDVEEPGISMLELEDMARAAGADYLLASRIGMSRVRTSKKWVVDLGQAAFDTKDSTLFSALSNSVQIKYGDSVLQASAYNGFKAVEELSERGAGWVRPLAYQVAEEY